MACRTIALLYRLVFGRRFCKPLQGVGMALVADGSKGASHEFPFLGAMGSMTGKAALLA